MKKNNIDKGKMDRSNMKGFKTFRHERNPKEKEFHDKFMEQHLNESHLIVFPCFDAMPIKDNDLTDREKRIVLSTIQWLGSPIGSQFLSDCGFELKF